MLCFIFDLTSQSNSVTFFVDHKKNCAQNLEDFRKRNDVIIAFHEDLANLTAKQSRRIDADNISDLFSKLCQIFGLDYIINDAKSFLVRSRAEEIQNSDHGTIHINIKDDVTGEPISFATVYDEFGKVFGFTDAQGDCFFKQRKSDGDLRLFVHSLSYKDQQINIHTRDDFFTFRLQADPLKALPISIKTLKKKLYFARTQSIELDQRRMDPLNTASIFNNDVIRNVQILPGVNATNDAKASLRIRGSHEEATLMVLDEMPIYRADHFYGIFGAFNGEYIDKLELFRNNIPVQYGGRTSGMLRMESKNKVDSSFLKLDANLLHLGIHTAIPLSKAVAVNIAYRKSLSNLTNSGFSDLSERENLVNKVMENRKQNIIRSNPDFDFYDFNGNLVLNYGAHKIKANVFMSDDIFNNQYLSNFLGVDRAKISESFNQENQWSNSAGGISYTYTSKNANIEFNTYYTSHNNSYAVLSQLIKRYPFQIVYDTFGIFNHNIINDHGAKIKIHLPKLLNSFIGLDYIFHDNELTLANEKNTIFERNRNGSETAAFVGFTYDKNKKWSLAPAFRVSYIPLLNKMYFLPQLYTTFNISESAKLKAAASRHLQFIRQIEHENILGQRQSYFVMANDNNIPIGIGQNYMLGAWIGSGHLSIDIEAYFRKLHGTIIHATEMPGFRSENNSLQAAGFKIFSGETRTNGIDLTLNYQHRHYSGLLSYTLSKTDNRFSDIFQNQWFPAAEDSRHQFKISQAYTIQKWEFNAQYVGATGRPYLDLSGLNSRELRGNLTIVNYISSLPAYHRWDLGVAFKTKMRKQDVKLGFSVFNVLDRDNLKFRQFVYQLPPAPGTLVPKQTVLGNDVEQLGRTFNVNVVLDIK